MLYRDDFEAARAKAEALERALQRSLSGLTTVEGAMAYLEQRLARSLAAGNFLIARGAVLGLAFGFWLSLGAP